MIVLPDPHIRIAVALRQINEVNIMMCYKIFHGSFRRAAIPIVLILTSLIAISAAAQPKSTFCAHSNCTPTKKSLKNILNFIVKKKSTYPTIYIGGYYMRDLVAGYEIFGNRRYLDTAIAYGDYLLNKQMPNGFWGTGYGAVYLADTGSALGLFIALYNHVGHARQKKYFEAVKRYIDAIQSHGMIRPNGALGSGWDHHKNGKLLDADYKPFTISSALTGAPIYSWMYHKTKQEKYLKIAYRALQWIFSTMRSDGSVRHIPKLNVKRWGKRVYGTQAYVGEGVVAFDLYCDKPAWKKWIEKAVRPNIEFLLRTQLPDGTWSKASRTSWGRTRSPGIVNYLIWYYRHVHRDPRIVKAVQRFDAYIVVPKNGKSYGLLSDGAHLSGKVSGDPFNSVTSLTGRVLADILSPGINDKW